MPRFRVHLTRYQDAYVTVEALDAETAEAHALTLDPPPEAWEPAYLVEVVSVTPLG